VGAKPQSLIGTPLLDQQRPLGVIEAISTRDGRPFTEIDKDVMTVVGNLASSGIIAAEKIQS
jgi:GAF domain-containing protein